MNYKQELQKEFSSIFTESALEFIFNETDQKILEVEIDDTNEETIYNQLFLETAHKFVFGKYNIEESQTYFINYLNNILNKNTSDEKKVKYICDFYKKIMFSPDIEHIIDLFNNNDLFYHCIENIYKKNKDLILNDSIEKIIDDDIFIQIIDIYLDFNNIEKENESTYEINLDELPQLDSIKMLILDLYKYPVLKHEQIINLFKEIENGNETAKTKIIEHNLRLALNIARRYISDQNHILDLFQEGAIGLSTAVDRFDYKKGYKFSTYATQWIRQGITRYIMDKGYAIRVPVYLRHEQIKFKKVYNEIKMILGKNPTVEEIAENSDYSIKTIKKLMDLPDELKSLNEKIKDDEDSEFGDFIDGEVSNTEEETERKDLSNKIQEWLNTYLTPKEKMILIGRMGLDGKKPRTLEDLGQELGVTRERIRQIEIKCIKKLRRSKMATYFTEYTQHPNKAQHFLEEYSKTGPATKPIRQKKEIIMTEHSTQDSEEKTKKQKSREHLYKYFSDFSVEQIDKVIEGLNPNEKLLLQEIYGENLKKPSKFEVTDKNKMSFITLLNKIKRRLNPKTRQKGTETKRTIKIYDHFSQYQEELIDKAIEKLSDTQKKYLNERYGNDLKNPQIKPHIDRNSQQRFYHTLKRLEKILIEITTDKSDNKKLENNQSSSPKINKSRDNLYKYFSEYPEEKIDKVIEGLEPKEKELLKQIYGNDLKHPSKFEVTNENRTPFYSLMTKIKRRLNPKTRQKVIETKRTIKIYDHFSEYQEELIDKAIEKLPEDQKQCLKSRYGNDLKNPQIKPYSDKKGSQSIHYIIKKIEKSLKKLSTEDDEIIDIEKQSGRGEKQLKTLNNNIGELYDNLYYLKLIRELPIKESTIMFLRKNYTNEQIADALNLSIEEVIEISKNAIWQIKAMYNNIFDEEVKVIENDQKTKELLK